MSVFLRRTLAFSSAFTSNLKPFSRRLSRFDFLAFLMGLISSTAYGSTDVTDLVDFDCPTLNLAYKNISDEEVTTIMTHPILISLDLANNKVSAIGAKRLALSATLTSLDLSNNNIGASGAGAFAPNSTLTALNLKNNKIGNKGLQALGYNTMFMSLDVTSNGISNKGLKSFGYNLTLVSLNLSHNKLSKGVSRYLKGHPTLKTLNLAANPIEDEDIIILAGMTLTSLDVSETYIKLKGLKALANNRTLTSLNLASNNIEDEGLEAFGSNATLLSLDVSHNKIGPKRVAAFIPNNTLTSLDLYNNKVGAEGAQALALNTTLTSLNIAANLIGDEGAAAFLNNNTLTNLNIDSHGITSALKRQVRQKILLNTSSTPSLPEQRTTENTASWSKVKPSYKTQRPVFPRTAKGASPDWRDALGILKQGFHAVGFQAPTWVTELPVTKIASVLSSTELQALQQVDKILEACSLKQHTSFENLSKYSQAKQKFSKAFMKVSHMTSGIIKGPEINSLIALQQRVNEAYGEELLKLDSSKIERGYKERLVELEVAHQRQEKELERAQAKIEAQLNASSHNRGELRTQAREIAEHLEQAEQDYQRMLARLSNPVQTMVEDFYDWKRMVFHDFIKLRLGNYFITYEALALGTVARHPEAYEHLLQKGTALASVVSDAFLPLGGTLGKVLGKVVEGGAELYADKQMRLKAAKIGSLYNYGGLEGMVDLSQEVASGLVYRLKDVVIDLTPESLDKLAQLATVQMIDYALKKWEDNEQISLTAVDLLLRSRFHQPSWLKSFTYNAQLETEQGQLLDGWSLLTQGQQGETNETRFIKIARSFAKQVRANGGVFLKYTAQIAKAAASVVVS